MKTLIFLSIFVTSAWAQTNSDPNEIPTLTDQEISRKAVSLYVDHNVQTQLTQSSEYQRCVQSAGAQFTRGMSESDQDNKAKAVSQCMMNYFGTKSKDELQQLSNQLQLERYRLVSSNNVKAITDYLSKKIQMAMTGVDPDEQRDQQLIQNMKFKNKKLVNQKDFITLYRNQMTKNALFVISDFCFNKFRMVTPPPNASSANSFGAYWNGNKDARPNWDGGYTTSGRPVFETPTQTATSSTGTPSPSGNSQSSNDPSQIYRQVFGSVNINSGNSSSMTPDDLSHFFMNCGAQIHKMCASEARLSSVPVPGASPAANSSGTSTATAIDTGANASIACVTEQKLQSIRRSINAARLVEAQFDQMSAGAAALILDRGADRASFFQATGNNSFDALTTHTSKDILNASTDSSALTGCADGKGSNCDQFYVDPAEQDAVAFRADVNIKLRNTAELERIKKLDNQGLREYLETNGYLELAAKLQNGGDKNLIETELGKIFDARSLAEMTEIRNKIGPRQSAQTTTNPQAAREAAISQNVRDLQSEKSRLASVVLFNNIITSQLDLQRDVGGGQLQGAGRNTQTLAREVADLQSSNVDPQYFSGIQRLNSEGSQSGSNSGAGNDTLDSIQFLDTFLGKPNNSSSGSSATPNSQGTN